MMRNSIRSQEGRAEKNHGSRSKSEKEPQGHRQAEKDRGRKKTKTDKSSQFRPKELEGHPANSYEVDLRTVMSSSLLGSAVLSSATGTGRERRSPLGHSAA
ncbi:uncharacterized [Tachysurus ichikawai]